MNGKTATGRPSRGEAVEEVGQMDADAVGQGAPQRSARHGVVRGRDCGGGCGGEQQWDGGSRLAEAGVAGGVDQEMTNKRCQCCNACLPERASLTIPTNIGRRARN